jgi:hypothetical protein
VCQQGKCTSAPFNSTEIASAATQAISKICNDPCIMSESLRTEMAFCLQRGGFEISCSSSPPTSSTCAVSSVLPISCSLISGSGLYCPDEATLFPSAMTGGCGGDLAGIILHEMVHTAACDPGTSGLHSSGQGGPYPTDRVFGCQESCFPGSTDGRGVRSACQ